MNVPATEFGRGAMSEDELRMWCCGRGLLGAGGVLCSVMSVLGKASSGWALRLSLVSPGGQSSLAQPVTPALPPRPSSLVKTSLEALRSSFSEELVMVAAGNPHQEKVVYIWEGEHSVRRTIFNDSVINQHFDLVTKRLRKRYAYNFHMYIAVFSNSNLSNNILENCQNEQSY